MREYINMVEDLETIYDIPTDIVKENGKYYVVVNGHYVYANTRFNSCLNVLKAIYITITNINQ